MRISCIIPTHRRPDWLREALTSVSAQTLVPHEVLVVDDAADPATSTTVTGGRWLAPVTLLHGVRPGASASRNLGVAESTGDVLAFLDDDDLWEPTYLAAAAAALTATGSDIVVTHIDVLEHDQRRPWGSIPEGLASSDVIAVNPGAMGSNLVLTRAAFASVGGFDEDLWVSNDKDLFFRLLQAGYTYVVVAEPLVVMREHGGDRLTGVTRARVEGYRRYLAKHRASTSSRDRRLLRAKIVRAQRDAAGSRAARLWHELRLVPLLGPGAATRKIARGLRARHGGRRDGGAGGTDEGRR